MARPDENVKPQSVGLVHEAPRQMADDASLGAQLDLDRPGGVSSHAPYMYGPGSRPLDGYTIQRGIGVGGFGEVYYAKSDAGKDVALKCVQFYRDVELRGSSQCLNLKNPHLVTIYDIRFDQEGRAWLVMEYLAGRSLKEVLADHPQGLPLPEVVRWFEAICAAVGYLHDQQIVHRDLKPANIFDDQGTVKVGDYGLAKSMVGDWQAGHTTSIGTCQYTAPEIRRGVYGKQVDIYSLGVLLYELLTGRVPFDGQSAQEVLMKHLVDAPDLRPVPEAFRPVVRRALAKDPARRFGTAKELYKAFQQAVRNCSLPEFSHGQDAIHQKAGSPPPGSRRMGDVLIIDDPDVPEAVCHARQTLDSEAAARTVDTPPSDHCQSAVFPPPLPWSRSHPAGRSTALYSHGLQAILIVAGLLVLTGFVPFVLGLAVIVLGAYALACIAHPSWVEWRGWEAARREVELARRRRQALEWCRSKPWTLKLEELFASWLVSAIWCLGLVAGLLLLAVGSGVVSDWLQLASHASWLLPGSIALSWVVLLCAKYWEGRTDGGERRLLMFLCGAALGAAGFAWSKVFQTSLVDTWPVEPIVRLALPMGLTMAAYFGCLLVFPAWWYLADPMRAKRFSWWKTMLAGGWALALHLIFDFAYPLGALTATVSSIAIQLGSSWMDWRHTEYRIPTVTAEDVVQVKP